MKQIKINGHQVTLKKHHRAKQLRLKVHAGKASVTMPKRSSYKTATRFAQAHGNWISKQLKSQPPLQLPRPEQKQAASMLCHKLTERYAAQLDVEHARITIRNQTTRWGSCSSQGNLSFNWRIILLPTELQNYLVIHELAHIKQPNHSKEFWSIVEKLQPNYRQLQKQLKQIDFAHLGR